MNKVALAILIAAIALIAGCVGQIPEAPAAPPAMPGAPGAPAQPPPPGAVQEIAQLETLAAGLEVPWALAFAPDGRLFFTEREGMIGYLTPEASRVTLATLPQVYAVGESGLMGIALDPSFEQNSYIYICYTYVKGLQVRNRISRLTEGQAVSDETILVDDIPGGSIHNGCRLKFGPDGKLYATTGDAGNRALAQDITSLGGKILRINTDGTIPSDNPYANSALWSYGHRNVQGIAWDAQGRLYASEHGPDRNDEINLIEKGKNYGWPTRECGVTADSLEGPVACFADFTLAPSGMAIKGGEIYVAGLRSQQVRKLSLAADGKSAVSQEEFITGFGRIRDAVIGPDGWLYFTTSNRDGRGSPAADDDKIVRIRIG